MNTEWKQIGVGLYRGIKCRIFEDETGRYAEAPGLGNNWEEGKFRKIAEYETVTLL